MAQGSRLKTHHRIAPSHQKGALTSALCWRTSRTYRSLYSRVTFRHIGVEPIRRLSAVRSHWAYGGPTIPRAPRHLDLPALLQVIGLGGKRRWTGTRRCRRRTSRAATTQTSPSERLLLLLRQSTIRLDPRRAAAVARCRIVRLEV